uniref:Uncharacterized protein n=1 Tax=Chenopodium quinoa TaxID=63459 RepID=A0A803LMR3_CHEQI
MEEKNGLIFATKNSIQVLRVNGIKVSSFLGKNGKLYTSRELKCKSYGLRQELYGQQVAKYTSRSDDASSTSKVEENAGGRDDIGPGRSKGGGLPTNGHAYLFPLQLAIEQSYLLIAAESANDDDIVKSISWKGSFSVYRSTYA